MESARERQFYGALGVVPDVPDGILERVERRARRQSAFWRAALAACLALALAIPALVATSARGPSAVYAAEDADMVSELFYALDYLNGSFDNEDVFSDMEFTYMTERTSKK